MEAKKKKHNNMPTKTDHAAAADALHQAFLQLQYEMDTTLSGLTFALLFSLPRFSNSLAAASTVAA